MDPVIVKLNRTKVGKHIDTYTNPDDKGLVKSIYIDQALKMGVSIEVRITTLE